MMIKHLVVLGAVVVMSSQVVQGAVESSGLVHEEIRFDAKILHGLVNTMICPTLVDPAKTLEYLKTKRVRKNVFKMSAEEWEKYAKALNVMKHTSTKEGKKKYGKGYRSYNWFVCQHARAAMDEKGDRGHLGPHFIAWHRAIQLRVEQILKMIDPTLDGAPYLDFRDIVKDPANSRIFSDEMYGALVGDENDEYQVKNGKFADWKVAKVLKKGEKPRSIDEVVCEDIEPNMYGLLRSFTNPMKAQGVTRMGGSVCNRPHPIGDETCLESCMVQMRRDIKKVYDCTWTGLHLFAHFGIGGSRPMDPNDPMQVVDSYPFCSYPLAEGEESESGLYQTAPNPKYGCYVCPTPQQAEVCRQGKQKSYKDCICKSKDTLCAMEGLTLTLKARPDWTHYYGDMLDITTSPNDPIFLPVHAGIDRFMMLWQLINPDGNVDYWKFPTKGNGNDEDGANLHNVMEIRDMFDGMFGNEGYEGNDRNIIKDKNKDFTYKDLFDATTVIHAPYTYDTLISIVKMCLDSQEPGEEVPAPEFIPNFVVVGDLNRWMDANAHCKNEYGTELATVDSEEKQAELKTQLEKEGLHNAWIGLTDLRAEGKFSWLDGTLFAFAKWGKNQPKKHFPGLIGRYFMQLDREDCVSMDRGDGEFLWSDRNCGYRFAFVCNAKKSEQEQEQKQVAAAEGGVGAPIVVALVSTLVVLVVLGLAWFVRGVVVRGAKGLKSHVGEDYGGVP